MSLSDQFTEEEILDADTDTSADPLDIKSKAIETFIDEKVSGGRQRAFVEAQESHLREFEVFVYWIDQAHVCMVDDSHVVEFNDWLKHGDRYLTRTGGPASGSGTEEINLSDVSRHVILATLVEFYNYLANSKGVVSENPAALAMRGFPEDEFDLSPPDRPRIEMDEMKEFLDSLDTPLHRAVILTLLKTGVRIGELLNIDLRCVHLGDGEGNTHPVYQDILDTFDVRLKSEVRNKPDSIFIYKKFNEGTEIEGEVRGCGNKRKDDDGSVIPVDDELKTALLEYLLTRNPPLTHYERGTAIPLFTKPSNGGALERLTYGSIHSEFGTHGNGEDGPLAEFGWYEMGADTEDNVFMHYFRHYFTDNMKHNHGVYRGWMPTGVIAYIRGDVDKSATVGSERRDSTARENTYSHSDWRNWKINVEAPYLNNIYKFGVYNQTVPRQAPEPIPNNR
jgi:integrase